MTERDDDIEFDFFDEPATEEATQRVRLPPLRGPRREGTGGGRRPPMRPTGDLMPLLRLVGLIAAAIVLIVVLVFWVQSCRGAGKRNAYKHYMEKVTTIAGTSQENGVELTRVLTTPGLKESDLENKLSQLAQNEQLSVDEAQKLSPPGPIRLEHENLIEALQFRASGLRGLSDAFRSTAALATTKAATAGSLLSAQAERLVASDVVWDDLFKDPAVAELKRQGISGVAVPDSNFVVNPDLASTRSMVPVWERIHGAATGGAPGGLHGTGLESVKALPDNITLSASSENTITATTDLAFAVTVKNTGDAQEVQVRVTLTIQKSPQSIVKRGTIDLIDPGQTKTLTFADLGQPPFGVKTTVKVDVQPVPGEKTTSNNSAEYPVIFSLG
jgi:molybdopterin-biosynthesis enzyme MoeA-like protein